MTTSEKTTSIGSEAKNLEVAGAALASLLSADKGQAISLINENLYVHWFELEAGKVSRWREHVDTKRAFELLA